MVSALRHRVRATQAAFGSRKSHAAEAVCEALRPVWEPDQEDLAYLVHEPVYRPTYPPEYFPIHERTDKEHQLKLRDYYDHAQLLQNLALDLHSDDEGFGEQSEFGDADSVAGGRMEVDDEAQRQQARVHFAERDEATRRARHAQDLKVAQNRLKTANDTLSLAMRDFTEKSDARAEIALRKAEKEYKASQEDLQRLESAGKTAVEETKEKSSSTTRRNLSAPSL